MLLHELQYFIASLRNVPLFYTDKINELNKTCYKRTRESTQIILNPMTMNVNPKISRSMEDHLSTLPIEITHMICDYLLPDHNPYAYSSSDIETPHPSNNPILQLSRTNRTLQASAQSWAFSFLNKHASITGYKPMIDGKKQRERKFLCMQRGTVFSWLQNHCVFCGKISARVAIMMNGFRCCMACDREQWPDKITRSEAKANFGLKDRHLPLSVDEERSSGWPMLRYGRYVSFGTLTTMYMKADVKKLAERVHGDLEVFGRKRDEERAERARRQDQSVTKAPVRSRKRRRRAAR